MKRKRCVDLITRRGIFAEIRTQTLAESVGFCKIKSKLCWVLPLTLVTFPRYKLWVVLCDKLVSRTGHVLILILNNFNISFLDAWWSNNRFSNWEGVVPGTVASQPDVIVGQSIEPTLFSVINVGIFDGNRRTVMKWTSNRSHECQNRPFFRR